MNSERNKNKEEKGQKNEARKDDSYSKWSKPFQSIKNKFGVCSSVKYERLKESPSPPPPIPPRDYEPQPPKIPPRTFSKNLIDL